MRRARQNGIVAAKFTKYRKSILVCTDERVKVENEVFTGMRAIKFYAWETPVEAVCNAIRDRELTEVRKMALWRAFLVRVRETVCVVEFALRSCSCSTVCRP